MDREQGSQSSRLAATNVWLASAGWQTRPVKAQVRQVAAGEDESGAGTTGLVADRLQLDATLIELNPEYAAIAMRRMKDDRGGLFAGGVRAVDTKPGPIEFIWRTE